MNWVDPWGLRINWGGISSGFQGAFSTGGNGEVAGTIVGAGLGGLLGTMTGVPGVNYAGAIAGGAIGGELGKQFDSSPVEPTGRKKEIDPSGLGWLSGTLGDMFFPDIDWGCHPTSDSEIIPQ